MTEAGQLIEPPRDPGAPTRHTLPSGKVVEVRSHRTMLGADVAAALASQSATGARGVVDVRSELICQLVTEIEPGRAGTPVLDGTLAAVLAQRADDYQSLYVLMYPAWRLCLGLDNITDDYEAYADPKAATSPPSEPSLD